MSSYNSLERTIARLLNNYPFVKKFSKLLYSRLVYLRNRKSYKSTSSRVVTAYSCDDVSTFFGYYDKSPVNSAGLVLACLTKADTSKKPSVEQQVELAVFDVKGDVVLKIGVDVHNWQQGCRAHWLDSDLFIYNDFDVETESYISCVYSVSNRKQIKRFAMPVQDSFANKYLISLSYQRLMTLRPDYGYRNLPDLNDRQLADLDSDGLWKIGYEAGEVELFLSISDICRLKPNDAFFGAVHKVNHVMISPDGSQFIFMHRYIIGGQRFDRLILASANTFEMRLLSDFGMVSHCFWADSHTILGYMRGPDGIDSYWLINVVTGEFSKLPCKGLKVYGDGHPHVSGDWFITDTYPDKARMQHLLYCNWKTGEVKEVAEFFHGFGFDGESRCDLHPRLSPDGKSVYFDSVFSGKRQLYRMELPV